ncbi:aspartate carbamoyltransferase regulatory subunit [Staphylothermus hellenicus]|uniref:Aspartate carbamoyltransferase regulatory chain n=1 Tax=Staphylothermus hellenicus (strain DSM 12710 / JCM 10830 / BK20S6-10-b1 / P8) TaxID=591019 RepID=D7DB10_STAHD|nr:aspartate carbamoyltransferase regulatory subunit [Staphylothermus hellenicus]ADI31357.1 aspartate carbamoyltransferase, regulatory subunit [Staphylothermus hellenicus DSM 12710]
MEEKLVVTKIRNGIVIDHIPAGKALKVLKVLGITGSEGLRVALVMNVESRKLGRKDIVKIEEKYLSMKELSLIALIAPTATINIIKEYKVVEKQKVKPPSIVKGLIKCPNPTCISRKKNEPIKSLFKLKSTNPIMLECQYCGYVLRGDEIEDYIET